jgi:hypothetical protein
LLGTANPGSLVLMGSTTEGGAFVTTWSRPRFSTTPTREARHAAAARRFPTRRAYAGARQKGRRLMSDRPRDESGRFTDETVSQTMNRLLRESRSVRQGPAEHAPPSRAMNAILRRAAGRIEDKPDEAA